MDGDDEAELYGEKMIVNCFRSLKIKSKVIFPAVLERIYITGFERSRFPNAGLPNVFLIGLKNFADFGRIVNVFFL